MIGKKLLTLACVLGILACGACFGPVYRPPIVRPLPGARTIQVVVTNVSSSRHLDPASFTGAIVDKLNDKYHQGINSGWMRATGPTDEGTPDAVLKVVILKESARKTHGLLALRDSWKGSVTISATLTASNGAVLWSGGEFTLSEEAYMPQRTSFDWDALNATSIWLRQIAEDLQEKVLYVNRP